MGRTGVARTLAVAVALLVTIAAGCGSSGSDVGSSDEAPAPTSFPPGTSGGFVVDPAPEGWEVERAYDQDKGTGVYYRPTNGEEQTFHVLTFAIDPEDPEVVRWKEIMDRDPGELAFSEIEMPGKQAYRGPLTDDGRTYGDQVTWFERPDLAVRVGVPFDSGLDVEEIAARAHEVDPAAFASLVQATSGGGEPGARIEAMSGEVDGDPWVLTAVLPQGYPVEPVERRRGCAELSFRGETASTCSAAIGRTFSPLDEGRQAILGDVVFGFGVIGEVGDADNHDVLVAPVERSDLPWLLVESTVVVEAPDLVWFVGTFDDVCDRVAGSGGSFIPVGVPEGYPHRNDCAA